MASIHTLDPERRSSKEKELMQKLTKVANEYIGELPLISVIGMVELLKLDLARIQFQKHDKNSGE
jgi:hypothetical protein